MIIGLLCWLVSQAWADPCGLVPPRELLVLGGERPIERTGVQQTFVFYRDGMQTVAIRPAFRGRTEDFGMLIPLPAPPSLHKVGDQLFEHLAASVSPPTVRVTLKPWGSVLIKDFLERLPAGRSYQQRTQLASGVLAHHEVRVLSEGAVGSYEVATLQAGSPQALARWMEARDYAYPAGMEAVVGEYVALGWVFVAVKARIGDMAGVEPRPGMTRAELALPPDAMFDGHVQGMAMRFEVDEAVIPMRLSTFNSDEHPNRVFILADQPMKITELPERMVARQVSGERLRRTLTEPLEVRMKGGTGSDLNTWQMARLQAARSPTPYTWVAAERFADDLLSAALGTHILPHEAWSTELVNISSALGLKGPELDVLHRDVVRRRRGDPNDELAMLDTMSLTVVDGDFPSHVLRKHNLHLSPWTLSADRNVGTPWSEEALPAPEVTLWIEG